MEAAVGSMASSHQERVSRRLGREYGSDQHETASYTEQDRAMLGKYAYQKDEIRKPAPESSP